MTGRHARSVMCGGWWQMSVVETGHQGCQEPAQGARMAQHICYRGLVMACKLSGVLKRAGHGACNSSLVCPHAGQAQKQTTTLICLGWCAPPSCCAASARVPAECCCCIGVAECTLLHLSCNPAGQGSRPACVPASQQPNAPCACGSAPNPPTLARGCYLQSPTTRCKASTTGSWCCTSQQPPAGRPVGRAR